MKKFVAFFEIPALDFDRAVAFYQAIFNLKLTVCDCGDLEQMAFFPHEGSEPTGAISLAPDFKPSADGVLVSLNVDADMEGTLARVVKNGGKVLRPKTKIEAEGMGYFALFADSEGNRVGLYSNK